ncbi:RNA polymerase sigma factor [Zhihengliuella halotolerans]|uniref:RNA polymerase sigma factor n=1 Tax=Zhihengliuella halotolerans TaxID=370736 RepID=UPI000C80D9EE|nr:RNA polymerase sigma factor [Zhihengliuella halotolerans]
MNNNPPSSASTSTDEALLRRARQGDGDAYGLLFDRHHRRIFRHALRFVASDQAEDVVAMTFLETWRRQNDVPDDDGRFLPWLIVTASNVARNYTRTERRYRRFLARLPPTPQEPDPALDVAHHVDSHQTSRELSTAFKQLPRKDQAVLTLCVLEELSAVEAGLALGIPVGTVKSRLSRAKRRLADKVPHLHQHLHFSL